MRNVFPLFNALLVIQYSRLSALLNSFTRTAAGMLRFPVGTEKRRFGSVVFRKIGSTTYRVSLYQGW